MSPLLNASPKSPKKPGVPRAIQFILLLAFAILLPRDGFAVETSDYAVQAGAEVQTLPPSITLVWRHNTARDASGYIISRKSREDADWTTLATLPGTETRFTDSLVTPGTAHEYQIEMIAPGYRGHGYVYAGIELPAVDHRGKVLLLVDQTHAADLRNELIRLEQDLIGDGWMVVRRDVSPDSSVDRIKALIASEYLAAGDQMKSLFLFGRIPVPYSGNIAPDGHAPNHRGAWPADTFYAEIESEWTDVRINNTTAKNSRHFNVPGDGKFDQSQLPAPVKLQMGRVDLSNMPAFGLSETELLRRYLDKNHRFRHKLTPVNRSSVITDAFGPFNGEAFASSGWRNFAPLLGAEAIATASSRQFMARLADQAPLWAYGCGPGTYTSAAGVGTTAEFATNGAHGVFMMLFGSYFGDWDSEDNFLRAPLAAPGLALATAWAGRPHWFFHHMGLGEPIGFSARVSQNNMGTYQGLNFGTIQPHVALMGDPTLRLHPVAPPRHLKARTTPQAVTLTWNQSDETVLGYHVFRSADPAGPFERLTVQPIETSMYVDHSPAAQPATYMVRALVLETSPSGTYFNLSQGALATVVTARVAQSIPATEEGVSGMESAVVNATATGRIKVRRR